MQYNEIFKKRRLEKGFTQQEVADKCRVALMTVSSAEQPPKKNRALPSEVYIKRFARAMGNNVKDSRELEKMLMIQRGLHVVPVSVQKYFRDRIENKTSGLCVDGEMPLMFRELVKNDWMIAKKNNRKISDADQAIIQGTIENRMFLPRHDVIKMANILGGDVDMYLLAADYLTSNLRALLNRNDKFGPDFGGILNRMPQKDLNLLMDIFIFAVNCYMKTYQHKIIQ